MSSSPCPHRGRKPKCPSCDQCKKCPANSSCPDPSQHGEPATASASPATSPNIKDSAGSAQKSKQQQQPENSPGKEGRRSLQGPFDLCEALGVEVGAEKHVHKYNAKALSKETNSTVLPHAMHVTSKVLEAVARTLFTDEALGEGQKLMLHELEKRVEHTKVSAQEVLEVLSKCTVRSKDEHTGRVLRAVMQHVEGEAATRRRIQATSEGLAAEGEQARYESSHVHRAKLDYEALQKGEPLGPWKRRRISGESSFHDDNPLVEGALSAGDVPQEQQQQQEGGEGGQPQEQQQQQQEGGEGGQPQEQQQQQQEQQQQQQEQQQREGGQTRESAQDEDAPQDKPQEMPQETTVA